MQISRAHVFYHLTSRYFFGSSQNLDKAGVAKLVESLNGMDCSGCEVVVCPVGLHLSTVVGSLKGPIEVAAQNCNFTGNGAYTGEISCDQVFHTFTLPAVCIAKNGVNLTVLCC